MTTDNPFLNFTALPRYADIAPEQVSDAVDTVLAAAEREIAAVTDASVTDWTQVMQPLEQACENINRIWNQVEHMHAVMSSPPWRAAHQANLPKIAAFYARLGQNEAVYRRVRDLAESPRLADLPAGRQKIVRDGRRDFELSGVGLPADKKEQFRKNSERLAVLSATFEEHLLEATKQFGMTVDDTALGDMPADLRDIAAATARANKESGYRFTLQPPSYMAFMQYSRDRDGRERMYRAYATRASELGAAELNNTPLLGEILAKRQQQAELLGFEHYAQVALETRMAPSAAAVREFLQDLAARAKPRAEEEMAELKQFAAAELGIEQLQVWDLHYAAEQLRRARFDFSDADLRPYLREDKIFDGLFNCLQQLFGIRLRHQPAASVWRDEVKFMEILDSGESVIGGVYLDLYARDDKRSGAWMADSLSRFRSPHGLQLPLAHVVCNFSKPVSGPALLNWDEVVTLFHEFGHAIHHLLTEIDDYSISGISGVEWDAVELPSQWLENFVWEWIIVQDMTAHGDSGEPMPRDLFDKATAARRFHSGLWLMRQLEFSLFDLSLHDGSAAGRSAAEVLQAVRRQTALLEVPSYNRFYCAFSHIFAGGYAAGYYSYLWAEVLAADVFMMFKDADSVLDRALGERFRREVLAVGGSRPAMESFVALRGREPEIASLLAHYGLAA